MVPDLQKRKEKGVPIMRRALPMAVAILLVSHANFTFANNSDRTNGVLKALEQWQPIGTDYEDGILVTSLPTSVHPAPLDRYLAFQLVARPATVTETVSEPR